MSPDAAAVKPLPPGRTGWPLLGETLTFLKDMFGFIDRNMKVHGPVFRTHLLGQHTAIMAGPAACERWLDGDLIQREGSFPSNVQELFGGRSLPLLDGIEHATRKGLALTAFDRASLNGYLPILERVTARTFAAWASEPESRGVDGFKQLAIEGISACVLGLEPGDEMNTLLADYREVMLGFTGLPIALPGTVYTHARHAKDRLLAYYARTITARRAHPTDDGLSKLLAARAPDGTVMTDAQLGLELHHIIVAGLIIFAEFVTTVQVLTEHTGVRDAARAECMALAPGELTPQIVASMKQVQRIVLEVKRFCPNVPVSFGKAKATFEFNGYTIPQGWLVFLAVGQNNTFAESFADATRFDPERFNDTRAEDRKPNAFVPQGPGPVTGHKCLGADFSTYFMHVFTTLLLRDYTWDLPAQDMSPRWDLVPPEPRDGLRWVLRRAG